MIAKMKARGLAVRFAAGRKARSQTSWRERPSARPEFLKRMIGKSAFICNECVERYHKMVTESRSSRQLPRLSPSKIGSIEAQGDPLHYGKTNRRHAALLILREVTE